MIVSMTGFGRGMSEFKQKKIFVEIRSLNSKQADISVKLPSVYKEKESDIRFELLSGLQRGKIECTVRFEAEEQERSTVFNESFIKEQYTALRDLALSLGISPDNEQLLQIVMRLPEAFKTESGELADQEWQAVLAALKVAINEVIEFRIKEGNALDTDISGNVIAIRNLLEPIKEFEAARYEKVRKRLTDLFAEWSKQGNLDNNRFEQELIYHFDKLDVNEEKVRLANHCDFFIQTVAEPNPVGKKLGFIAQEIGREINTLGSKAQDADIQKLVVVMKDKLEQVKEQLMNVI
ncbi:MAG TPA: YicC family protein [Bacteroidales bacterium]|nr:YicC family protein [Bacteroidales bacterium]